MDNNNNYDRRKYNITENEDTNKWKNELFESFNSNNLVYHEIIPKFFEKVMDKIDKIYFDSYNFYNKNKQLFNEKID